MHLQIRQCFQTDKPERHTSPEWPDWAHLYHNMAFLEPLDYLCCQHLWVNAKTLLKSAIVVFNDTFSFTIFNHSPISHPNWNLLRESSIWPRRVGMHQHTMFHRSHQPIQTLVSGWYWDSPCDPLVDDSKNRHESLLLPPFWHDVEKWQRPMASPKPIANQECLLSRCSIVIKSIGSKLLWNSWVKGHVQDIRAVLIRSKHVLGHKRCPRIIAFVPKIRSIPKGDQWTHGFAASSDRA